MLTASVVVDVNTGYMELALPENYKTNVSTECIQYNEQWNVRRLPELSAARFSTGSMLVIENSFSRDFTTKVPVSGMTIALALVVGTFNQLPSWRKKVGPPMLTADSLRKICG